MPLDKTYIVCDHCRTAQDCTRVGTLNPQTFRPEVVWLCARCAARTLRLNRAARRAYDQHRQRRSRHTNRIEGDQRHERPDRDA